MAYYNYYILTEESRFHNAGDPVIIVDGYMDKGEYLRITDPTFSIQVDEILFDYLRKATKEETKAIEEKYFLKIKKPVQLWGE